MVKNNLSIFFSRRQKFGGKKRKLDGKKRHILSLFSIVSYTYILIFIFFTKVSNSKFIYNRKSTKKKERGQ